MKKVLNNSTYFNFIFIVYIYCLYLLFILILHASPVLGFLLSNSLCERSEREISKLFNIYHLYTLGQRGLDERSSFGVSAVPRTNTNRTVNLFRVTLT